jgi:hypothetical protein
MMFIKTIENKIWLKAFFIRATGNGSFTKSVGNGLMVHQSAGGLHKWLAVLVSFTREADE